MAQPDAVNASKLDAYAVLEGDSASASKVDLYAVLVPNTEGRTDATLGDVSSASTGAVEVSGSASIGFDDVTGNVVAVELIVGSASATFSDLTLVSDVQVVDYVPPQTASFSAALDHITLGASALVFDPISGGVSALLDDVTVSGVARLLAMATASVTLDPITSESENHAVADGELSQTLEEITAAATVVSYRSGAAILLVGA